MSSIPDAETRDGAGESVAGFLAAFAIAGGAISIVERPVTVGLFSLFVALVASALAAGRHRGLAAFAVAATTAAWFAGMVVSVLTNRPLW